MKTILVAVKDLAQNAFMAPASVRHTGQAIRGFVDEVNRKDQTNQCYMHPGDFELWQLGTFDDESGQLDTAPERLMRGTDAKTPE